MVSKFEDVYLVVKEKVIRKIVNISYHVINKLIAFVFALYSSPSDLRIP